MEHKSNKRKFNFQVSLGEDNKKQEDDQNLESHSTPQITWKPLGTKSMHLSKPKEATKFAEPANQSPVANFQKQLELKLATIERDIDEKSNATENTKTELDTLVSKVISETQRLEFAMKEMERQLVEQNSIARNLCVKLSNSVNDTVVSFDPLLVELAHESSEELEKMIQHINVSLSDIET